jgi:hypothetical protein
MVVIQEALQDCGGYAAFGIAAKFVGLELRIDTKGSDGGFTMIFANFCAGTSD